jgi:hypothetical protein
MFPQIFHIHHPCPTKNKKTYFRMSLEHLPSLTKVPLLLSKDIAII